MSSTLTGCTVYLVFTWPCMNDTTDDAKTHDCQVLLWLFHLRLLDSIVLKMCKKNLQSLAPAFASSPRTDHPRCVSECGVLSEQTQAHQGAQFLRIIETDVDGLLWSTIVCIIMSLKALQGPWARLCAVRISMKAYQCISWIKIHCHCPQSPVSTSVPVVRPEIHWG